MITRRTFGAALAGIWLPQSPRSQPAFAGSLVWGLDSIDWQPDDPPGSKYAVLYGDRDRPGMPFCYAFWLPGGVWAPAHRHSQTAHVAVMQGTLRLGYGARSNRSQARRIGAGQFFVVEANEPHFEGSDDECLIIGTALGGWTTTVVE